jgi:hypothetical protein
MRKYNLELDGVVVQVTEADIEYIRNVVSTLSAGGWIEIGDGLQVGPGNWDRVVITEILDE